MEVTSKLHNFRESEFNAGEKCGWGNKVIYDISYNDDTSNKKLLGRWCWLSKLNENYLLVRPNGEKSKLFWPQGFFEAKISITSPSEMIIEFNFSFHFYSSIPLFIWRKINSFNAIYDILSFKYFLSLTSIKCKILKYNKFFYCLIWHLRQTSEKISCIKKWSTNNPILKRWEHEQ